MKGSGMIINLTHAVPLLMICLLSLQPAYSSPDAATPKPANNRVFSIHDTNHDGYVSEQEYLRFVEKRLDRLHRHGIKAGRYARPLSFTEIDSDRDLLISESEMLNAIMKQRQHRKRYRFRHRSGKP